MNVLCVCDGGSVCVLSVCVCVLTIHFSMKWHEKSDYCWYGKSEPNTITKIWGCGGTHLASDQNLRYPRRPDSEWPIGWWPPCPYVRDNPVYGNARLIIRTVHLQTHDDKSAFFIIRDILLKWRRDETTTDVRSLPSSFQSSCLCVRQSEWERKSAFSVCLFPLLSLSSVKQCCQTIIIFITQNICDLS